MGRTAEWGPLIVSVSRQRPGLLLGVCSASMRASRLPGGPSVESSVPSARLLQGLGGDGLGVVEVVVPEHPLEVVRFGPGDVVQRAALVLALDENHRPLL